MRFSLYRDLCGLLDKAEEDGSGSETYVLCLSRDKRSLVNPYIGSSNS